MAERMIIGVPAATFSPGLTRVSTTTPGMGAPTEPASPAMALGRVIRAADALRSSIITERGMPLKSKKTSRMPDLASSLPTAWSLIPRVLPFSSSTEISSPSSMGSMYARVGSLPTSPNASRSALYCSYTFGYMTHDMRSVSPTLSPYLALRSASAASRLRGGSSAPGRPAKTGRSLTTCFWSGCGKPPCGTPIAPWKNSTTDDGNESESACARTAASSRLLVTMNCARSPTTLEEGVTLTMSPSRLFAAA
mmetsp:Transcript_24533/g.62564  ORF Transcript_24533/g.62564 Transcript_24533/m.62564 type:complete len:251 (-) Transcript_24533:366-1118(-)